MHVPIVRAALGAVTVLAILTVACADSPVEPTPDPVAAIHDFTNGPASPGPNVMRTADGTWLVLGIDQHAGLLSIIGLPADPTNWDACGGSEGLQTGTHSQFVELPGGAVVALETGQGRNVAVYDLASFLAFPTLCGGLTGGTLVATGTADVIRNDNDVTGVNASGANSFGWRATGIVEDAGTGEDLEYREIQRLVILPDGTFKVAVGTISLEP